MNFLPCSRLKLASATALVPMLAACTAPAPSIHPGHIHGLPDAAKGCQADQVPDAALVGKTESDAVAMLKGCPWRIGERDGQQFPGTMDFDPTRRTLGVSAGKVTWVRRG